MNIKKVKKVLMKFAPLQKTRLPKQKPKQFLISNISINSFPASKTFPKKIISSPLN